MVFYLFDVTTSIIIMVSYPCDQFITGLNGGTSISNGYQSNKTTDNIGVKFISLASPLTNGVEQKMNGFADVRIDELKNPGKTG